MSMSKWQFGAMASWSYALYFLSNIAIFISHDILVVVFLTCTSLSKKMVHSDIKSNNILIDDDFNAKVSDFSMAKLLGIGKCHITTQVLVIM